VATPRVEEKPLTAKEIREVKEKKGKISLRNVAVHANASIVLYYRHKLQRGFLARDTTPKEDEMKVGGNPSEY